MTDKALIIYGPSSLLKAMAEELELLGSKQLPNTGTVPKVILCTGDRFWFSEVPSQVGNENFNRTLPENWDQVLELAKSWIEEKIKYIRITKGEFPKWYKDQVGRIYEITEEGRYGKIGWCVNRNGNNGYWVADGDWEVASEEEFEAQQVTLIGGFPIIMLDTLINSKKIGFIQVGCEKEEFIFSKGALRLIYWLTYNCRKSKGVDNLVYTAPDGVNVTFNESDVDRLLKLIG